jgi:hypothetical protein
MEAKSKELESVLLRRWRKRVRSDPELRGEVRGLAKRLLSGVQGFVEDKQWRLVEAVIAEAALVPLVPERPVYVV